MNQPKQRFLPFTALCALVSVSNIPAAAANLPPPPPPIGIPAPGPSTDAPYAPQSIVPGGVVIPLFPPDSPFLNQERINEAETYGSYRPPYLGYIVNIHNPSIEFHAGNGALNTGTAIIIAAGGGHKKLNVVGEGADLVPHFSGLGISTILLRNRLRSDGYDPKTDGVHDLQQAIKLVRAHARDWDIDPDKIGVLGFSAGAELCAASALFYEGFDRANNQENNPLAPVSSRPDFIGLVYPGPSPFFLGGNPDIPRDAPPAFFASPGWGDWTHAFWATEYFTALLHDGVPNAELHIYARGVHPGDQGKEGQAPATAGITSRDGVAFGTWQDRFIDWLDDLGFMAKPGIETRAAIDVAANLGRIRSLEARKARLEEQQAAEEKKEE